MEIALVVLSIISLSFMIAYVAIVKRLKVVSDGFAQLLISYNAIVSDSDVKNTFLSSPEDQDIHKENFIKFLSDSRDWAFDYIEEVQTGLSKFIQEVEPQIEYYNNYGIVVEGMAPPHDYALEKISKEFNELKKLLPEDTDDRR
jgi:hypothetical protein